MGDGQSDDELLNEFEKEVVSDAVPEQDTKTISTRVDELVALVKEAGEISVEDAAAKLGIGVDIIESWVTFLEEERILSVKYNFTTPLISLFHEASQPPPKASPGLRSLRKGRSKKNEAVKESLHEPKPPEPEVSERTRLGEGATLQQLLDEAYRCIKQNEFDKAREVYALINQKYQNLPNEFLKTKDQLTDNLIQLSKDLEVNINKKSSREMDSKYQQIMRLITLVMNNIKDGEILDAVKKYGDIKRLYDSLPDGFIERKLELQNKILDVYEVVLSARQNLDVRNSAVKKAEVVTLMEEANQAIEEQNLRLAIKLYERIRQLYKTLPAGFFEEKAELQSKIVLLYNKLLSHYKHATIDDMNAKSKRIKELTARLQEHLTAQDIAAAKQLYAQIKELFYSLPEGFLRQKTELHKSILALYAQLASQIDRTSSLDFQEKCEGVTALLGQARELVRSNRLDQASKAYQEMIAIYNNMPSGFIERKTTLRNQILAFYKEISSTGGMGKTMFDVPKFVEHEAPLELAVPLMETEGFMPHINTEASPPLPLVASVPSSHGEGVSPPQQPVPSPPIKPRQQPLTRPFPQAQSPLSVPSPQKKARSPRGMDGPSPAPARLDSVPPPPESHPAPSFLQRMFGGLHREATNPAAVQPPEAEAMSAPPASTSKAGAPPSKEFTPRPSVVAFLNKNKKNDKKNDEFKPPTPPG